MIREEELIVDCFAGGGGASTGIAKAAGRPVDIAINHDPMALAMHAINHPKSRHIPEDIFDADLIGACNGRPIGGIWYSPDCTYFSAARGGKPIREEGKKVRALSTIVLKHARNPLTRPRGFILENVPEYQHWGPVNKRGKPIKKKRGVTFRLWWRQLEEQGCRLEMRELYACDYGAGTKRKRLFVIGRFDDEPIVWPEPTHGDPNSEAVMSGRLLPWRTAADCIDFSLPCPSIFGRKKRLAFNTERRVARGFIRYVADNPKPYFVDQGTPYMARIGQTGGNGKYCNSVEEPITTATTKAEHLLVMAYMAQHNGGMVGHKVDKPLSTTTNRGTQQQVVTVHVARHTRGSIGSGADEPIGVTTCRSKDSLVATHLVKLKGTCRDGSVLDQPVPAIAAGGTHHAICYTYPIKYFGTDQDPRLGAPLHTITSKHRFGLCETATIHVDSLTEEQRYNAWWVARFFEEHAPDRFAPPEDAPRPSMVLYGDYIVWDLGMRMLQPRELFRAQGFPDDYIIDFDYQGEFDHKAKPLSKEAQVRMCGNSVPPQFAEALWRANFCRAESVPHGTGRATHAQV